MSLTPEDMGWIKLTNRISVYDSYWLRIKFRELINAEAHRFCPDGVFAVVSEAVEGGIIDSYELLKLLRDIVEHVYKYKSKGTAGPVMTSDYETSKFLAFKFVPTDLDALAHHISTLINSRSEEEYYSTEAYVLYYLAILPEAAPDNYEKYLRDYKQAEAVCQQRGII